MEKFHFVMPYHVRIADINYGGHVANSAVLNFFQDARISLLAQMGPYAELDIGAGLGLIQTESHIYYRAEMFLNYQLNIGLRITNLQRSNFTLECRIEREGEVTIEGSTTLASIDYKSRKLKRLPDPFRRDLESLTKVVSC